MNERLEGFGNPDASLLFRRHVRRPRLTALLENAVSQCVIANAPPGYGKTTLAREWALRRNDVVWYRATNASADIAAFAAGVAEALRGVLPHVGERLHQRLRVSDAPERDARVLAELLAADVDGWPDRAWLVIDDYHLNGGSNAVEDFVDWLLTLSRVRVLILSRRLPAWATARGALHGELTQITRDQLAFTQQECRRILQGRASGSVSELVRKARGWPVLISLAALAQDTDLPREQVQHSLFQYFADEVFRGESTSVQELLLLISVPPSITAETASHILALDDAMTILERLADDGLLTRDRDTGFSLHPLLREFLVRKLATERPDDYKDVAARLLEDALAHHAWDEAVEIASQVSLPEVVLEVISRAGPGLLASGRLQTLESWYELCGSIALTEPDPILVRAGLLIRRAQVGPASALTAELAERIDDSHPAASRACYVAGQSHHLLSETQKAFDLHVRAHAVATTTEDRKNALWGLFIAAAELELEDFASYLDALGAIRSDQIDDRLRTLSGRVTAAPHLGSYDNLQDAVDALLPYAEAASDPMVASGFLTHAAYLSVARGRYADGLTLAERALAFCRSLGLEFATAYCSLHLAGALIGLRSARQAQAELRTLEANKGSDSFLSHQVQALYLKLALSTRVGWRLLPESALEPPSARPPRAGQGEVLALQAAVRLALGEHSEAHRLAREAIARSRSIEACIVGRLADAAASAAARHPPTDDQGQLLSAVREAMDAQYGDAVVMIYRAFPPLIPLVKHDPEVARFVRAMVLLANDTTVGRASGLLPPAERDVRFGALTARETEILDLVAQGWSNEKISKHLYISVSTTKVHVHRVFKKLGVSNRLQAAIVYREANEESDPLRRTE